jgi:hypothetical protein
VLQGFLLAGEPTAIETDATDHRRSETAYDRMYGLE